MIELKFALQAGAFLLSIIGAIGALIGYWLAVKRQADKGLSCTETNAHAITGIACRLEEIKIDSSRKLDHFDKRLDDVSANNVRRLDAVEHKMGSINAREEAVLKKVTEKCEKHIFMLQQHENKLKNLEKDIHSHAQILQVHEHEIENLKPLCSRMDAKLDLLVDMAKEYKSK